MLPARWALARIILAIFECLPTKMKSRIRLDSEKKYVNLKMVLPLERHKLADEVETFVQLADKFPSDRSNLIELVRSPSCSFE